MEEKIRLFAPKVVWKCPDGILLVVKLIAARRVGPKRLGLFSLLPVGKICQVVGFITLQIRTSGRIV